MSILRSSFTKFTQYVNPALGKFLQLSGQDQRFVEAKGCQLKTNEGEIFYDWIAGYGSLNLGHNPPQLLVSLQEHLQQNPPNLYMESLNPYAGKLAEALLLASENKPQSPRNKPHNSEYKAQISEKKGHSGTVFFSNSGSEAVEAALKIAMKFTQRRKILYVQGAYHGTTMGSLSMMEEGVFRTPFEPLLVGFDVIPWNHLADLEEALQKKDYAAFILEPIQIEAGIRSLQDGYLSRASQLCQQYGSLLIVDEVQTGMGRTGSLFLYQQLMGQEKDSPDLVVVAKSLGGGLVPISAVIAKAGIFEQAFPDSDSSEILLSTFGGNALACHLAYETLAVINQPHFLNLVKERGRQLAELLHQTLSGHPLVQQISMHGLLGGIRFHEVDHPWLTWENLGLPNLGDSPTIAPLLVHRMRKKNFLVEICGHDWHSLRIEPPLIVSEEACQHFVKILHQEIEWIHSNFS